MSLINDAIKRVSKSKPPPKPHTAPAAQWRAVETRETPSWWLYFIPPLMILALGAGVYLLIKGWQARHAPITVAARERQVLSAPAPTPQSAPANATAPSAPPAAIPVETPAPSQPQLPNQAEHLGTPTANPQPTSPPVPAVPTFPNLKLQGIYFRPSKPSIVINTETLYVGDRIQDAKVTQITKDSATVVWNGEVRVLTLR